MKVTRRSVLLGGLGFLAGTVMTRSALAEQGVFSDLGEGLDDLDLATEAYLFAYPLVTMELTRRVFSNVTELEGTRGPMGQLIKMRGYPDASFRDVTAPNADTLYTNAFFDVGTEPWVLSIPNMKDRYFLMPLLDGWTTVFQVPGKRTTGTGPQTYAITGPGWKGTLPEGVKEFKSSTSIVWLLGRIYCTGTPEDYAAVHNLQDEFRLVPLSAYGKPFTPVPGRVDPSIDMKTAVREQVNRMDAVSYFTLFCELMKTNPPSVADTSHIARFGRIGIVPGKDFDKSRLKAEFAWRVPDIAFDRMVQEFKSLKTVNGWSFTANTGIYGSDYLMRALVTAIGLGANRPEDAIYPTSKVDAKGRKYHGSNNYVICFPKGYLPPVEGFWSLTMYDEDYFFVNNPLNRYSISPRQHLKVNHDGSTYLYIQKDSPGKDKESNWLPAPSGAFILMLRLYWPRETDPSLINGTWSIPPVQQVETLS
ncbi:DUF1254 domain-containing protein [Enterobacter ludwigii]|uniref:DUF1254 domain-containing protein n=1 Tax=Enterobacter ludwigii TaxID=299767 RepID=UPI001E2F0A07|nr:DUF1254 domain-containing protein [Enterobacter ludwigii]MCE1613523.1 DUF1254 domain-containing protein [Enterobacter ludwigii]MCE1626824.1 DUF1254 domain-containing protein [Enterobacter ludwigii]